MCATGDTEGEKETVFTDRTEAPREREKNYKL